jgi:hypothetical protein
MKHAYYLPIFLILAAFLLRVFRHFGIIDLPPNFAPIGAMALFSGAVFTSRRVAFLLPLIAMIASDFFIGWYDVRILIAVYGSFLLSVVLGLYVQKRLSIARIFGSAIASSVMFFLITNFAVWLFSGMYPVTFSGLGNAYLMGLPFLKWTIAGDIFYTGILFGLYYFILAFVCKTRHATVIH